MPPKTSKPSPAKPSGKAAPGAGRSTPTVSKKASKKEATAATTEIYT